MDISTQFSYLFGTEEYVGMRRQLVFLRETLSNHIYRERNQHIIYGGSLGEGVAYPESDDDMMLSQTNSRVVKTYREATQAGDVLMVPSEFSPGYCLLLDAKRSYNHDIIYFMHEMSFISSSLWKQFFAGEGRYIHGPCQSQTIGTEEFDYAVCIPCYTWPDIANNWIVRERSYSWPSCEMIQNIVHNGCHVVSVGDPDSPIGDHEWRISFSVAERSLMHSFNHTQFLVYNLLRLTLKRVIDKTFPGVICSYFLKTTLFYTAESTPMELWRVGNLEKCFTLCLSVLYDYVDYVLCPNFFIPEYNMIKRKVNHTNRIPILQLLRTVHTIGIAGIIHLSGESFCLIAGLSATMMEFKLDREFMFSSHIVKCFMEIENYFSNLPDIDIECSSLTLSRFLSLLECNPTIIRNEFSSTYWYKGIIAYCLTTMNYLFSSSGIHKHNYRLYKTLKVLLRKGYRGDLTTIKLTMATYMYMAGKTEPALCVIQKLLSDSPPYAIDCYGDEIKIRAYMDVMCGRGFTLNYKIRHAHAPHYSINKECILNAFPSPLKMWLTIMSSVPLEPLTYAYFLESLCHDQHQNQPMVMKSLKCLDNHMGYLKDAFDIVSTRMCVGIIKYVLDDSQSACRWFGSIYVMKDIEPSPFDEMFSRSALTYIACLLNKKFQSEINDFLMFDMSTS